ncbi:MAG: hypothetical protein LC725_09710 [Lentisphaerae bacterium]|nr:hypothetical protein [Lentisphaerota bacterium]
MQDQIRISGEIGSTGDLIETLRTVRTQVLNLTLENAGESLTRHDWALPFCVCYDWSLRYEFLTHEQAAVGIREVVRTLQQIPLAAGENPENPHNAENLKMAAYVAARVTDAYVDRWMDTNAPECVDLLDAVEDWVLSLSDSARVEWFSRMIYTQGNLLSKADQFDPSASEWLWQSRQERLRAYAEAEELHLIARTRVVTHWSKALFFTDRHPGAAERLLTGWWLRFAEELNDPEFFEQYMRVLLFEAGDWERAGILLERANVLRNQWTEPTQRTLYERTANLYYKNIFLLGYELRRVRGLEIHARHKKVRERAATY